MHNLTTKMMASSVATTLQKSIHKTAGKIESDETTFSCLWQLVAQCGNSQRCTLNISLFVDSYGSIVTCHIPPHCLLALVGSGLRSPPAPLQSVDVKEGCGRTSVRSHLCQWRWASPEYPPSADLHLQQSFCPSKPPPRECQTLQR